MSTTTYDYPTTLNDAGMAFKNRVQNPNMFRAYMLAKQTTLGVTGAYLDVIELDHVRLILPSSFTTKDLFGRTSTAALLGAAEMCSAAALMLQLRNQRSTYRPKLKSLQFTVLDDAPDHELMSFETESAEAHALFVAQATEERPDELTQDLKVLGRNQHGELSHEITLTWSLSQPE